MMYSKLYVYFLAVVITALLLINSHGVRAENSNKNNKVSSNQDGGIWMSGFKNPPSTQERRETGDFLPYSEQTKKVSQEESPQQEQQQLQTSQTKTATDLKPKRTVGIDKERLQSVPRRRMAKKGRKASQVPADVDFNPSTIGRKEMKKQEKEYDDKVAPSRHGERERKLFKVLHSHRNPAANEDTDRKEKKENGEIEPYRQEEKEEEEKLLEVPDDFYNSNPPTTENNESLRKQKKQKRKTNKAKKRVRPQIDNMVSPIKVAVHAWKHLEMSCELCVAMFGALNELVKQHTSEEDIINAAKDICKTFKIETDRVCDLVVPQYSDMALGVLRGAMSEPREVCGLAFPHLCPLPYDPLHWNLTLPDTPKPPVKPRVLPKEGSPTLRALHMTDIHTDVVYLPGADAQCGEPLCCRAYDLYPAPTEGRRAGQWGDYRHCDLPFPTLEQVFQHLSDISDQFDYVMFTGDIAAHDIWNQTRESHLDRLGRLSGLFRKYLPDKPVYTSLGNHEGLPCNSFPPSSVEGQSLQWMYDAYLEAWGYWLPDSVSDTIMKGGYYTFSPYPGFRIISLNSNYGSHENWWLFLNATDPEGQLHWLANTLQHAEDKGEKVHILSHHPPSELLTSYALNYYRIINRYENTIVAQFGGHTHKDHYEVFYDLHNTSRAVGMAYIAGSLTPYVFTNPAFRIYTIDGQHQNSSWEVLDFSHFYLDLPYVNTGHSLTWQHEYTATDAYKMPSVFPEDWANLVYRMRDDDTLFQKFYRYYSKSAEEPPCDSKCKSSLLCSLKTAGSGNKDLCNDL